MAHSRRPIHIDKGVKIFLRPNSSIWQLQVWYRGKRTCESLGTEDVELAKSIARRRFDDRISQTEDVVPRRNVTYKELFEVYEEHAKLRNRATTRELNFRNLRHIVRFMLKRIKADRPLLALDFTVRSISAYAAFRQKKGRKPDTINRELGTLSVLFSKAKKSKLVPTNPVADVERIPSPRNKVPKTLTESEVERLLVGAAAPVDHHGRGKKGKGNSRSRLTPLYELLVFLFNTGARLAEAIWFEYTDINFEENLIQILNKRDHTTKTGEERVIRGNKVLMKLLRARRMRQGDCRWVFPSITGDQLDRKNVLRELKGAARRAGINPKRVNFLIIRHTALTASAKGGAAPFVLKEVAGHATIRTTERYYLGRMGGSEWIPPSMGG